MSFFSKINGTTMNEGSQEALPTLESGIGLKLVREPLNPYDKNAICIMLDDLKLGYIPKQTAESLAKEMDLGKSCYAVVTTITGGKEGQSFGCNIEVFVE